MHLRLSYTFEKQRVKLQRGDPEVIIR